MFSELRQAIARNAWSPLISSQLDWVLVCVPAVLWALHGEETREGQVQVFITAARRRAKPGTDTLSTQFTRRKLLKAAGAGAAWIALAKMPGCEPEGRAPQISPTTATSPAQSEQALTRGSPPAPQQSVWSFRSRPDLGPPAAGVDTQAHDTAPGYIFVSPERGGPRQGGPMIVDDRGQVVWFRPLRDERTFARDFKGCVTQARDHGGDGARALRGATMRTLSFSKATS